MSDYRYLEVLKLAAPETIVVLSALLVLAVDLVVLRGVEMRSRVAMGALLGVAGCVGAAVWLLAFPHSGALAGDVLVADPLSSVLKVSILALTVFSILLMPGNTFTSHIGEYFALMLMGTAAMMFLVSAGNLLMIFLALEGTSLALYVLAAFHKRSAKSAEAALKYFLFGGMSAAFTLFGLSLVYGFSGAITTSGVSRAMVTGPMDPLLILGLVMTVIGFGFKVAAAPFHLWAPDAYEGAPIPSAALIASGSKVAGFFILAKLLVQGFAGAEGSADWGAGRQGWIPLVAALAFVSLILGNLVALRQTSVRRLLAWSAVAHAGYTLLGILPANQHGLAALIYYSVTYGLTAVGAFGVVAIVQEQRGSDKLSDFARPGPPLATGVRLHAGVHALAGGDPAPGWVFRQVHSVCRRTVARKGFAVAGAAGDRDERGVALLLLAGVEADLGERTGFGG